MKILYHLHRYVPEHGAGAEWMAHSVLSDLALRGHEAKVLATMHADAYNFEGIDVAGGRRNDALYEWADVVFTHLDATQLAVRDSRRFGKPLVHFVHNDRQLTFHRVRPLDAQLVVANSRWLNQALRWKGPSMVVRPPVFADRYRVKRRGDAATLINLTEAKGSKVFWELARRQPHRRFIGVLGAYGHQDVPDDMPSNVELRENTPNIRSVYARTRVLLMPSSYESWGRCAVEAAASGIPTIAHATPGLLEALGPAGIFASRDVIEDWELALGMLDDRDRYEAASADVLNRSDALEPTADLVALELALHDVLATGRPARSGRR